MNQHTRTANCHKNTIVTFVGIMTVVMIVISFTTSVAAQHYEAERYALISQTLCFGAGGILTGVTYVGMLAIQRFRR